MEQVLSEMLKPDAKVHLLIPLYLNSRESTSEVINSEKSSHGWGETGDVGEGVSSAQLPKMLLM